MSKLQRMIKAGARVEQEASERARALAPRLALLLGIAALAIYARTLHPSVGGGDSGELITVARGLGVAHPPGYPLYTLLAHAFTWIPHGTIGWRVNLLSAFCDAGAAALLALAVAEWAADAWAGLAAGALFAFSPLTWRYAVTAEVFALNNLFVAAELWLLARYARSREAWVPRAAALAAGLALSNQLTFALYLPPLAAAFAWIGRSGPRAPGERARLALLFAAGLLPYAYLPIAGRHPTTISWGDTSTLAGLLKHLLRREYGTFQLGTDREGAAGQLFGRLGLYALSLPRETLYAGIALAALGLRASFARAREGAWRAVAWGAAGAFTLYAIVFHALANTALNDALKLGVQARFWQQLDLVAFAWAGLGLAEAARKLKLGARGTAALACALGLAQAAAGFRASDQSGNFMIRDYGRAILSPLPAGALLVLQGDQPVNAVHYVQRCEGFRPDVRIVEQELMIYVWATRAIRAEYPDVAVPGTRYQPGKESGYVESGPGSEETRAGSYSMRQFLEANLGKHPLFVFDGFRPEDAQSIGTEFATRPYGLASQVIPLAALPAVDPGEWRHACRETLAQAPSEPLESWPADSWERSAALAWLHARERAQTLEK